MRRFYPLTAAGIFSLFLFLALAWPVSAALVAASQADYVEGEVLVRFRPAQTTDDAARIAGVHGSEWKQHFAQLSQHEGRVIGLLHSTKTTAALLAELRADPAVESAEPNYLRYPTSLRVPNDPRFGLQWSFQNTGQMANGDFGTSNVDISFLKAWGLARPATNEIVVGVIDTGLDSHHPDIISNRWTNLGEIAGNGVDDDGNGYVDDIHGYDFSLNTGAIADSGFHGTHVSGTIAASGNNNIGVIGVDFQAHIMTLKVSGNGTNFSSAAIVSAFQYATHMKGRGVNIVALNGSYGGGGSSSTERSAIQAAGDAGIIFVNAAGNDTNNNDSSPVYPASYRLPNMIVVAASDQNDSLANFSNYGATTVDLAAPGVDILSLAPTNLPSSFASVVQSNSLIGARTLEFAGTTTSNGITSAIYYCGLGNPGDFPRAVTNNIALIQRGTLDFTVKVANAMAKGARAAIIYNNIPGNFNGTLVGPSNWIPAVAISQADGTALSSLTTTGTVVNFPDIYQYLDGTSMAAPHVAGAVAFAALNFPNDTVAQRIRRVLTNTTPIAAFSGKVVTGGRLNLARIVDSDGNGLPDWWEQQYFAKTSGVATNADPDQDGQNNLAEFLAGTIPTNSASVFALATTTRTNATIFKLQWPSVSGHFYRLLRATNLATGFNTILQTNITATPPLNLYTDTPPATVKAAYYRLQLEP
ncbi:MAG TPA: S8 family serine peptidase [Verrucomicrobiae bacterium]|nr:S8 family serine peptidase [Verrucomicrobiae bacterium]